MVSSNRQDWGTPQDFFDALNDRYKFTIDLFASAKNALCPRYYSADRDALSQSWIGEHAFGNPEYGPFVRRTIERATRRDASCTVLLVPARVCTGYWMRDVWPRAHLIHFLQGRIKFAGAKDPAPFESALLVYLNGDRPEGDAKVIAGPLDKHPAGIEEVRALWK